MQQRGEDCPWRGLQLPRKRGERTRRRQNFPWKFASYLAWSPWQRRRMAGEGAATAAANRARERGGCAATATARLSRAAPSASSMHLGSLLFLRLALLTLLVGLANAKAGTRPSFVSDKMIATAASVVNACQTQTGVTTADIESVRNGQWPDSMELKQFGLIDEKRELSLNGMLTFFQRIPAYRNEVQQAISECKALATGDSCEYAYTFNKCYADRSPRTYYLF